MRSADVERAIAELATAIARQEGEAPDSERRFTIEGSITAFVENQLHGGYVIVEEVEE